ncbi:P1 family peptidase [Cellulomonas endophytica]|uniref:P1 family peptidase n=1 Tax=Cellulomonas endophytica TaxID=2494735 RepID=UPI001011F4D2|nr:P1 family peptidase [Cellulomonas endophytica]
MTGSVTDVAGVRVGQVQRTDDGWLTGVTVVLPPPGTVGGVDVRGGGPGTHETDALDPRTLVATVDAVVLTGGSAFGLVTAHGVQRWCAAHGRGFRVGAGEHEVVPIVPAAAVFDLGRGGRFDAHPDEAMGHAAAVAAAAQPEHGPVARGTVGAGTGAAVDGQRAKGGVGTASVRVRLPAAEGAGPDEGAGTEVVVGAIAVVNAAGAPLPLLLPGADGPAGTGAEPPEGSGARDAPRALAAPGAGGGAATDPGRAPLSTTIACVVTDALLDPAETSRTATAAHGGLARALDPVHTLVDGDTVFALATGAVPLPADRPGRVGALVALQAAAAHALEAAVRDGVRSATAVRTAAVDLPVWAPPAGHRV